MSRKRLRQQRRQGVTEKASAATEARCHGKSFGSNGGMVSRNIATISSASSSASSPPPPLNHHHYHHISTKHVTIWPEARAFASRRCASRQAMSADNSGVSQPAVMSRRPIGAPRNSMGYHSLPTQPPGPPPAHLLQGAEERSRSRSPKGRIPTTPPWTPEARMPNDAGASQTGAAGPPPAHRLQSAEQRSRSRSPKHRITTTPPWRTEARMPRDAGASQPGVAFAQSASCSELVGLLLTTCTDCVYDMLQEAHEKAPQPRIAIEGTTRYGSFSQVVHTLKLAYAANLKQCLFHQATEEHSKSVRDLSDIITAKLNHHCDADAAQLGAKRMEQMLKHLLEEFQWDVTAQIFEECALTARSEKAKAYEKASQEQNRLKETRSKAD